MYFYHTTLDSAFCSVFIIILHAEQSARWHLFAQTAHLHLMLQTPARNHHHNARQPLFTQTFPPYIPLHQTRNHHQIPRYKKAHGQQPLFIHITMHQRF